MTIAKMIRQIEQRRAAIGGERDKLEALIMELESLRDSCDRAYDDLSTAIDALSEHA